MKDLHIHTIYSDGEYNEQEILEKIKEANIKEFSICDHDTIEGSKKVCKLLKKSSSNLIFHSGVELSCRINTYKKGINVHLLVRDFDFNDTHIQQLIEEGTHLRNKKIHTMCEYIKEQYNIIIPKEDIEETLKYTNSFGKPHLYKILTKYIDVERESYYKTMDKLDCSKLKLDAVKVLQVMKNTKGNVTLAHPIEIMKEYNMSYADIEDLVKYLVNFDLYGLETMHSKHSQQDYLKFSKIAKKYNLIETQGSDYHGPTVKPNVKLGICKK